LRHAIRDRDDIANLGIMYYRVLTHTARQWKNVDWHFHPDTNPEINWQDIASFLSKTPLLPSTTFLSSLFDLERDIQSIEFNEIEPTDSLGESLVQLADLFTGMTRFSREEGQ